MTESLKHGRSLKPMAVETLWRDFEAHCHTAFTTSSWRLAKIPAGRVSKLQPRARQLSVPTVSGPARISTVRLSSARGLWTARPAHASESQQRQSVGHRTRLAQPRHRTRAALASRVRATVGTIRESNGQRKMLIQHVIWIHICIAYAYMACIYTYMNK